MNLKAGSILKSTPLLDHTVFEGVYILIVEYNEKGAVGFILNKPYDRSLHHLEAFRHLPHFELYNGGPVDHKHLYFIHQRPDLIDDGIQIDQQIYWGGNFSRVVEGIEKGTLTNKDVKIFVGYCGWEKGELEAEIEEGSWVHVSEKTAVF